MRFPLNLGEVATNCARMGLKINFFVKLFYITLHAFTFYNAILRRLGSKGGSLLRSFDFDGCSPSIIFTGSWLVHQSLFESRKHG